MREDENRLKRRSRGWWAREWEEQKRDQTSIGHISIEMEITYNQDLGKPFLENAEN